MNDKEVVTKTDTEDEVVVSVGRGAPALVICCVLVNGFPMEPFVHPNLQGTSQTDVSGSKCEVAATAPEEDVRKTLMAVLENSFLSNLHSAFAFKTVA